MARVTVTFTDAELAGLRAIAERDGQWGKAVIARFVRRGLLEDQSANDAGRDEGRTRVETVPIISVA